MTVVEVVKCDDPDKYIKLSLLKAGSTMALPFLPRAVLRIRDL